MITEGKTDGWLRLSVDLLPSWAAFNNVRLDGIKIAPMPGFEDRGSTIVARRHLDQRHDQPIMTIPSDLILSLGRVQEHAKADADFRQVLEALADFGRVGLLYFFFIDCPSHLLH